MMIEYLLLAFLVWFYCKCSKLGLWVYFSQATLTYLEACLLCSLPRVGSRGELTWKCLEYPAALSVFWGVLLAENRAGLCSQCIITPQCGGIYTLHINQGHCTCQSGQPAVKIPSTHSLPGFKEVGKEVTPERGKNYSSLLWCFKTQMDLMYVLISSCRIPALNQMSATNHKLTHN